MSGNKARHRHISKNKSVSQVSYCCAIRAYPARTSFLPFADLVVIAKEFYPIPFRTRPSKPSASMVLRLKPRESRTLPGLPRTEIREPANTIQKSPRARKRPGAFVFWRGSRARGAKPAGFFPGLQPSSSADRSAANSFSSMKSGSRYCGKLLDILSLRSTCRQKPCVSAKWSSRQPLASAAATKP